MKVTNINSVKIGSKIKVRNAILTVTGTDKHGFVAQQEHNGKTYTVTIPLSSFGNPHLAGMEVL